MTGRPKDPKTARNKNVLVIGGSGSGKTRFYVKPNLMQCFPTSDYGAILLMIHSNLPLPPTQGIKLFKMHLLSRGRHPVTAPIRALLPQDRFPWF